MPLVPIHIRGKKRAAAKSNPEAVTPITGEANTQAKAPRKKARRNDPSRRVSVLERLPLELLVMVFTESQNMEMLYCNRYFHKALNNYYSHVRLVAAAFAPTWSANHGKRRREEVELSNPPQPGRGCRHIVRCQVRLCSLSWLFSRVSKNIPEAHGGL